MSSEFEAGDVDALKELLRSRGYALLKQRLEFALGQLTGQLERDLEPIATGRCRGGIAALKMTLGLPAQMLDEAKKAGNDDGY